MAAETGSVEVDKWQTVDKDDRRCGSSAVGARDGRQATILILCRR
jgi:hypothetical protein